MRAANDQIQFRMLHFPKLVENAAKLKVGIIKIVEIFVKVLEIVYNINPNI